MGTPWWYETTWPTNEHGRSSWWYGRSTNEHRRPTWRYGRTSRGDGRTAWNGCSAWHGLAASAS